MDGAEIRERLPLPLASPAGSPPAKKMMATGRWDPNRLRTRRLLQGGVVIGAQAAQLSAGVRAARPQQQRQRPVDLLLLHWSLPKHTDPQRSLGKSSCCSSTLFDGPR